MLFGRQTDLATIAGNLTATPGDSFALVGGRRMGKTSLLEGLLRTLTDASTPGLLLLPLFLDLSGAGVDSVPAFFRTVGERARDGLAARLNALPPGDCLAPDQPPAPAFARWLAGCGKGVLAEHGRQLRLALLLDECEQIVAQPWAAELYATLRYLLVGQITRPLLKVVMAGSHRFLTQVRERGSPLRNVLRYHHLAVLDEPSVRDLIIRPGTGRLPGAAVQAVVEQSGGHPFLTQYLMHHLWAGGLEQATPETVRQVAAGFSRERHDFADWLDGLGESGTRVYRALAGAGRPVAEAEVRAALRPVPPDLLQTLEALCYHGLAVCERSGYRTAGAMFRQWFADHDAGTGWRAPSGRAVEAAIVRVQTAEGAVQGTGFIIAEDGLVVTCAHVVAAAGEGPGGRVELALRAGGARVEAEVLPQGWRPDADVALLRPLSPLPTGARPAVLGASPRSAGRPIAAFGYPTVGRVDGLWGTGEVVGPVTEDGRPLLQLRSTQITAGFSGGPVTDSETGQVIGMVTEIAAQDRYGRMGDVAFAIPIEDLLI
jgi:S1-C subfamily serine protease